ncbi:MAG: HAD-IC family P-type ATPase [Rheinheimera sp.]|nr:HAD-IC family P-type ATPase [Rheinheimera sp.]
MQELGLSLPPLAEPTRWRFNFLASDHAGSFNIGRVNYGCYGSLVILSVTMPSSRPAQMAVRSLQQMNIKVVMLTGDNYASASEVAEKLGLDDYKAELLPQAKTAAIKQFQAAGHQVAMVGDGINDAPALAQAQSRHCHWHRHRCGNASALLFALCAVIRILCQSPFS